MPSAPGAQVRATFVMTIVAVLNRGPKTTTDAKKRHEKAPSDAFPNAASRP